MHQPHGRQTRRATLVSSLVVLALSVIPQLALAQVFDTGANNLVTYFIVLATPIAVIAIMVLAIVAMTGRVSWGWPIGVLLGVGVIFGAPQLVDWARGIFGV